MKNNYLNKIFLFSMFVNASILSAEAFVLRNEYNEKYVDSAAFDLEIIYPDGKKNYLRQL